MRARCSCNWTREISRAKRGDQTLAVLVVDLDGFKQINDRFGHLDGNKVLRQWPPA